MKKLKQFQEKEIVMIICILCIIEIVLMFYLVGLIKKVNTYNDLKQGISKEIKKENKNLYNTLNKKINNKYDIKFNELISYPLLEGTFDTEKIENIDNDIEIKKLDNILKYIDSKDTKKEDQKVSYSLVKFNKRSIEEMYSNRDCDKNLNEELNCLEENKNDNSKLNFDFNKVIGKKKQYVNNKKKISVYIFDKKYEKQLSKIKYYTLGKEEKSNLEKRFKNIERIVVYEYDKKYFVKAIKNNQIIYIVAEKTSKNELIKMIKNIDNINI